MGFFDFFKKKDTGREQGKENQTRLNPESQIVINFDDEKIWCTWPGESDQTMLWSELIGVAIKTTDEGPFSADVFWILGAKDRVVMYPGGATGEHEMLSRLQKLPNFNNESVISAAGCTDNNVFICWEKETQTTATALSTDAPPLAP